MSALPEKSVTSQAPWRKELPVCVLDMTIPYFICILNNIYHIQLYFILYIFLDIHIHHICHSVLCAISKCFLYFSTHVNFISPTSHPTFSAFFVFYPSCCHVIMDVHNWFFNMQSNIGDETCLEMTANPETSDLFEK